nr:MAG TPA: hypothetical protein [Bacteriophage sp.]
MHVSNNTRCTSHASRENSPSQCLWGVLGLVYEVYYVV